MIRTGILLPEAILYGDWFGVLATFVAINTLIYVVLGLIKVLPQWQRPGHTGASRRSETRSIYPDAPL